MQPWTFSKLTQSLSAWLGGVVGCRGGMGAGAFGVGGWVKIQFPAEFPVAGFYGATEIPNLTHIHVGV